MKFFELGKKQFNANNSSHYQRIEYLSWSLGTSMFSEKLDFATKKNLDN